MLRPLVAQYKTFVNKLLFKFPTGKLMRFSNWNLLAETTLAFVNVFWRVWQNTHLNAGLQPDQLRRMDHRHYNYFHMDFRYAFYQKSIIAKPMWKLDFILIFTKNVFDLNKIRKNKCPKSKPRAALDLKIHFFVKPSTL